MKIKTIIAAASAAFSLTLQAQWSEVNIPDTTQLRSVSFIDNNIGYVCGKHDGAVDYGKLWRTADGGQNWTLVASAINVSFNSVEKTADNFVWVAGDSGLVFRCDLANNFFIYQNISSYTLNCGSSPDSSIFYCAGDNGVLYSTYDSGIHWDTLQSGTLENINDIYFENAAEGWIVADGGYIASTLDSGNTWTFANQPFWGFRDLNSLSFQGTTGMNPYVVGSNGAGMFSTDGGSNWFQYSTNTGSEIACIQFGTTNGGIMCGTDGFVSRTSNGGGFWSTDVVPRAVDYNDVAFGSDSVAYICGDSGVVLKSTVDVSGIPENSNVSNLNAFPNPASEQLYIELNSEVPTTYSMRIFDITGTEVLSQQNIVVSGQLIIRVDNFSELANGIYFITVTNSNGTATSKVVKN
jgi:photosystem II stability/assembly factor-like uncharacterized protein